MIVRHAFLTVVAVCIAVTFCTTTSHAAAPDVMNFQGRLTDNIGNPLNGNFSLTFNLYNVPAGGTALWTETHANVPVVDGLFNVLLGSFSGLTDDEFSNSQRYLGVTVEADPEQSPRIQIASVGYALRVATVDSATGGDIVGDVIVYSTSIANGLEVVQSGLGRGLRIGMDNAFSTESAVAIAMQGSGAGLSILTSGGPAIDVVGGAGDGAVNLPFGSISSFEITDGTVTGADISDGSITGADIADGSVDNVDIATNAITGIKVAPNTLTQGDLGTASVGSDELADNAVSSPKILDGSILSQDVDDEAIDAGKLANEAGVAQAVSGANYAVSAAAEDITSRNITVPTSGYVLVIGSAEATITHLTGTNSNFEFGVSDFQTGTDGDQDKTWRIPAAAASTTYKNVLSAQKIFAVTAGSHDFWIICGNAGTAGSMSVTNLSLSVIFFPTSYGAVIE